MAPSQPQTAPTPRRCCRSKDQRTNQVSVLDFAMWDDMEVIFTVSKAARKPAKNIANSKIISFSYGRTMLWSITSDRPDPVPGSY